MNDSWARSFAFLLKHTLSTFDLHPFEINDEPEVTLSQDIRDQGTLVVVKFHMIPKL